MSSNADQHLASCHKAHLRRSRRASTAEGSPYDAPDEWVNLDELAVARPVENVEDTTVRRHHSLEQRRSLERGVKEDDLSEKEDGCGEPSPRLPAHAIDDAPHHARVNTRASGHSEASPSSFRRTAARHAAASSSTINQPRSAPKLDHAPYNVPDGWTNLDELAVTSPVENVDESPTYPHHSLDETRSRERDLRKEEEERRRQGRPSLTGEDSEQPLGKMRLGNKAASHFATQLFTLSYLIFFSFLGTLARIGLAALNRYPDAPLTFSTVWANFGGSLVMGFLAEDRSLFRWEWGSSRQAERAQEDEETREGSGKGSTEASADLEAAELEEAARAHLATKKTIPLYIGLATGFCGCFTSFSAFIRDCFLALSNDLAAPGLGSSTVSRSGGYSFMALLAVIITTIALSTGGLFLGAHLAIALERVTPSIPFLFSRRVLDPLVVFLGWGCWVGAVLLSIFPPQDDWRGRAVFALVFAPVGCLMRFYLAVYFNGRFASFPLGTFCANVFGTMVLGMAWDLANAPYGGLIGCQVLQGVEDGFCGCLTTVSMWVAELSSLRRRSAYMYGAASVIVALASMIAIMGGLRWTDGFNALKCS